VPVAVVAVPVVEQQVRAVRAVVLPVRQTTQYQQRQVLIQAAVVVVVASYQPTGLPVALVVLA